MRIQISVYADEELNKLIQEAAWKTGRSVSNFCSERLRDGMRVYLARKERENTHAE